jgi:hypothetical protein
VWTTLEKARLRERSEAALRMARGGNGYYRAAMLEVAAELRDLADAREPWKTSDGDWKVSAVARSISRSAPA